ncbi:2Fe-2S iron-sulfur cluster-binding protein [Arenibaculum pallidiluteum]|uniref:2Fe-2S iron-sulfur cluster-binding protein n=1 Tax=Arenibaculum pallidiluteum TaxID=2812559 RepID=UPI001A967468|nr:2Fe-2S iron-sulfur cluster-binding protein [Arenibaculum pallidiluteum]
MVNLTIDGRPASVPEGTTIVLAAATAGIALTTNVGCMGQGVCGACRALVRRTGEPEVRTALACETPVEDGMQVSFLDRVAPRRPHAYSETDLVDGWTAYERVLAVFPEAVRCRHCSGCDRACPKGLEVQKGVNLAASGDIAGAAAVFDLCVMCNLCVAACPEHIAPNHLGLFARRLAAAGTQRPADLIRRLHEITSGAMTIDADACTDKQP